MIRQTAGFEKKSKKPWPRNPERRQRRASPVASGAGANVDED
jgi:hypothetical protein